jgi:hypothetical protein
MIYLTTTVAVLLLAQEAHAATYCNGYYCRRRGIRGGAIAGIVIGALSSSSTSLVHSTPPPAALALLFLCLLCTFLRRARRMRFRSPGNGSGVGAPGRQYGFMYFPSPNERTNGINTTTPHMAETGMGQRATGGAPPMNMPVPQTAAAEGVASPPPAYNPQGKYQPVSFSFTLSWSQCANTCSVSRLVPRRQLPIQMPERRQARRLLLYVPSLMLCGRTLTNIFQPAGPPPRA